MLHVKDIRAIISAGETDQAHAALDQLLALGPGNTEALKLRATLFEGEGRFADEALAWEKVARADKEDPDAVAYLLRRQMEDREHFYFTDDVPGGGRRFLAYPRALIRHSAVGLVGCVAFLISTRFSLAYPVFAEPRVMLTLFGLFVILPWISIMAIYFGGIRSVTVASQGVTVATRIKRHSFLWTDLDQVYLANSHEPRGAKLSLVFLPKDPKSLALEIDIAESTTPIRARSYLVREIKRLFNEPAYVKRQKIDLANRKVLSY